MPEQAIPGWLYPRKDILHTENWLLELADHYASNKKCLKQKKLFWIIFDFGLGKHDFEFNRRPSVHILLQYVHISHIKLIFGWVGLLLQREREQRFRAIAAFSEWELHKSWSCAWHLKRTDKLVYTFSHRYLYEYKYLINICSYR